MSVLPILLAGFFLLWFLSRLLKDPFKGFLVMLPFMVVTRSAELPIVGERIILFDVLLLIWWLGIGLRRAVGHRDLRFSRTLLVPAFVYYGFLTAAVLSLISAPVLINGIEEIAVYAFAALWGLAVAGIATSEERIEALAKWILWIVLGVILVSFAEARLGPLGLFPTRGHGVRLSGPFRQTNQLASFLRTTAPLVWASLLLKGTSGRARWMLVLTGVGGIFVLLLTSSRFNIAVTAIELIVFIVVTLYQRARGRVRYSSRAVIAVGVVALVGVAALPRVAGHYWQTFIWRAWPFLRALITSPSLGELLGALPTGAQVEFATRNWSLAWQAFLDSPLRGVGIGNFGQSYQIVGVVGTEVHSLYAGILAETGLFGFLCVLVFLLVIAQYSWKLFKAGPSSSWLTVGLVVSLWGTLVSGIYIPFLRRREFWLTAGLLLAHWSVSFQSRRAVRKSRAMMLRSTS